MDLEENKVKVKWIYLRKFVPGTVQGDQFLFILLEFGYKYNFDCYSVFFFSQFSDPHLHGFLSLLYYLPPFLFTLHV